MESMADIIKSLYHCAFASGRHCIPVILSVKCDMDRGWNKVIYVLFVDVVAFVFFFIAFWFVLFRSCIYFNLLVCVCARSCPQLGNAYLCKVGAVGVGLRFVTLRHGAACKWKHQYICFDTWGWKMEPANIVCLSKCAVTLVQYGSDVQPKRATTTPTRHQNHSIKN